MFGNPNDSVTDEDNFKCYKTKTYKNSDGDPFGLTIKGKNKEYLKAHAKVKSLVNIKRFKEYFVEEEKVTIVNTNVGKSLTTSVVGVESDIDGRGKVELKIYHPSENKKRGLRLN